MITLGSEGEQITVILAAGGAFVVTLVASEPWPTGLAIALHLSTGPNDTGTPVVWSATIASGSTQAVFNVAAAVVQTALNSRMSFARLYYTPSGGQPLLWGQGGIRAV